MKSQLICSALICKYIISIIIIVIEFFRVSVHAVFFVVSLHIIIVCSSSGLYKIWQGTEQENFCFEIPAYPLIEQGISRVGKFKTTQMCLSFHWISCSLQFPCPKIQTGSNFKIIFPIPYTLSYITLILMFLSLFFFHIFKRKD